MSGRQRASVPSATFVNYDTSTTNQLQLEKSRSDSKIELHSERENREAFYDPEEGEQQMEENGVVHGKIFWIFLWKILKVLLQLSPLYDATHSAIKKKRP